MKDLFNPPSKLESRDFIQLGLNKGLRKYTSKGLALEQDEN